MAAMANDGANGFSAGDALNALSGILSKITAQPFDLSLHKQNVQIAVDAGLNDEAAGAREMLAMFLAVPDNVWLPLLAYKEQELGDTLEGTLEVLELYKAARNDYLSVPLLLKNLEFLIDHQEMYALSQTAASGAEEDDVAASNETAAIRTAIKGIVEEAAFHLTKGHLLWDRWRDWELSLLETTADAEKSAAIARIEQLFMSRLQSPHSTLDDTFQAYSSFTTANRSADEYESRMVTASKARASAVKAWELREKFELGLNASTNVLHDLASYISAEQRLAAPPKPDARKGRGKAQARNLRAEENAAAMLRALYERAIAESAARAFAVETGADAYLRAFWSGYLDVLRQNNAAPTLEIRAGKRAVRSVPGAGQLWAKYLRILERHSGDSSAQESVKDAFERALETQLLQAQPDELTLVVQGRADYERRSAPTELPEDDEDGDATLARVVQTLEGGIELVRKGSKDGDPRLRLEKHLSAVYAEHPSLSGEAVTLWERAAKHYKTSYIAWVEYLGALARHGDVVKARALYKEAAQKPLDWPEMLWDAWVTFEHLHGSVSDMELCLDRIAGLSERLAFRRAKEAQVTAVEVPATALAAASESAASATMNVDATVPDATSSSRKRKAQDAAVDEPAAAEPVKKVKIDDAALKRDRENSTVFVADLPDGTVDDELKSLFKDCGDVREVKITTVGDALVATVEFMARDSVPAALTRDKKRVKGQEVAVHLAWKSTLYVTNFPEGMDDQGIRSLFAEFGVVFDVRWPSKKFKDSRRFCYVQFTSPDAAQAALSLHGRELAPELPLSVYVSDPGRKKERTDAGADEREIYIAGLSRYANKDDLQGLFRQFGAIKEIRMAQDEGGHSKGFAFIEFDENRSAQSALSANNHELKKRRIAVTLADPRVRARHRDTASGLGTRDSMRSRSVRVRNLPEGTQEGLLQQTIEKVTTGVKRVEVFEKLREALVEFNTVQDAGRVLLNIAPVVFLDNTLSFAEELLAVPPKAASQSTRAPVFGGSKTRGAPRADQRFIPRVAAVPRPRAGLGSKKRVGFAAVSAGAGVVSKESAEASGSGAAAAQAAAGGNSGGSDKKGQDDFRQMLSG